MPQTVAGPVVADDWGAFPGVPPADFTDTGRALASVLPPVDAAFSADMALRVSSSPLALWDRAQFDTRWSAEAAANNPAVDTISGRPSLKFATTTGLRSTRQSVGRGVSGVGVFEVTADLLAGNAIRKIASKGASPNYGGFLIGGNDNYYVVAPGLASNINHLFGTATLGVKVACFSIDEIGQTVHLYINNTETPFGQMALGGTLGSVLARWAIGCSSPGVEGFDGGEIAEFYCFDREPLHGSATANAARRGAMTALAKKYGVTLGGTPG